LASKNSPRQIPVGNRSTSAAPRVAIQKASLKSMAQPRTRAPRPRVARPHLDRVPGKQGSRVGPRTGCLGVHPPRYRCPTPHHRRAPKHAEPQSHCKNRIRHRAVSYPTAARRDQLECRRTRKTPCASTVRWPNKPNSSSTRASSRPNRSIRTGLQSLSEQCV